MDLSFVFNLTLSLLIVIISPLKFNVIIYMDIHIYFPVSLIFFSFFFSHFPIIYVLLIQDFLAILISILAY